MKRWLVVVCLPAMVIGFAGPRPTADAAEREKITLESRDGVRLTGDWYAPQAARAPAVLLLHMLNGGRGDWTGAAQRLQREGYAVLAIDLRGHGESTRKGDQTLRASSMSDQEFRDTHHDVAAAFAFLEGQQKVDGRRIGLAGAGLGAHHALRFAAGKREVKTLILLSPGLDEHGLATHEAMLQYDERPVMIVASLDDRPAAEASRQLESVAVGKKKLKLYDRAGRGTRMLASAPDLLDLMADWLDETL